MKKQNRIIFSSILIFTLIFILFPYIVILCSTPADKDKNDLLYTETLPEDELDRMLADRGIETSIIDTLPIWEKQYLLDWNVDSAIMEKKPESPKGKYKKISDEIFSMQVIVARIWEEKEGNPSPMFRVIIPYRWEKLPLWTGTDDLTFVFGDSWLPQDDYRQVNYIRKKEKLKQAVADNAFSHWNSVGMEWEVDIKRSFTNTQKDGYVAITLRRPYNFDKNKNEILEVQVCYTHNIITPNRGASLAGKSIKQSNSIWKRYYLVKRQFEFSAKKNFPAP